MGLIDSAIDVGLGFLGYGGQRDTNQTNRDIARDTNRYNRENMRETNEFNRSQSRESMAFQERMSSTAYQRARADLAAAGFNPILAVNQGGASSPGGANVGGVSASGTTGAPMHNAVASAIDALRTRFEIRNMQETNRKIESDTALNHALANSAREDAVLKANSARNAKANAILAEASIPGAQTESRIDQSSVGTILRYLNRGLSSASGVVNLFKPFVSHSSTVTHRRQ